MHPVRPDTPYRDHACRVLGRIAERLSYQEDFAGGWIYRPLTPREQQLARTYDSILQIIAPDDGPR